MGHTYVTQTQRRKTTDLDILKNRDWITNDLSLQSADDKREIRDLIKYFATLEPGKSNRMRDFCFRFPTSSVSFLLWTFFYLSPIS